MPIQWIVVSWLSKKTDWIENNYSQGIYPFISKNLQAVFGSLPFSFGDLVYALLIIYVITWIYRIIKFRKFKLKAFLLRVLSGVSIVYFFFYFNWGMNYFRKPLDQMISLEKTTYTDHELYAVTKTLVAETNNVHLRLVEYDTLLVTVHASYTKNDIRQMVKKGYADIGIAIPNTHLAKSSVKPSLFSEPLSYMGFAGYLNPWSNESQINTRIPLNAFPATASHEIAHQLGFGSESEANFIGYIAGMNHSDDFIQYSSSIMALRYCLFEVYKRDKEVYQEFLDEVHIGIKKDFKERQKFWDTYQNWSEPFFKLFYDSYLKANNQTHGIQSYNRMVGLVVNYRLKHHLK